MKKTSIVPFLILLIFYTIVAQQFTWQTTQNGSSGGNCQLVSDFIRITIGPFHADVEEEAMLSPIGPVWNGDSSTLELIGQFQMTQGAALRSMLLWEGNTILKAKLIDRAAADSAYEAIVGRDKPQYIAHDPAKIIFLGNGQYEFRIFPVPINGARKIRILYSIPFTMISNGPRFNINTVFTFGASQTPSQIPVEIHKSTGLTGNYILFYGSSQKTIQFGATYQIAINNFYQDYYYNYYSYYGYQSRTIKPLTISPDTSYEATAFTTTIDTGRAAGHYTAVFAVPPDTIRAAFHEFPAGESYSVQAEVITGEKVYITDYDTQTGYLGMYLKSANAWDSLVTWRIFNSKGKDVFHCNKSYKPQTDSLVDRMLPIIWAAKYSLVEGNGNLGAMFGFVDRRMALLAREGDSLSSSDKLKYAEFGVPLLNPNEIIVKASELPVLPRDNAIFEIGTGVLKGNQQNMTTLTLLVKADRHIALHFGNPQVSSIKAVLFDVSGRVLKTWSGINLIGASADLRLPPNAKGCLILRVFAGKEVMQKKFTAAQ
jgi:hypothetical protein